MSLEAYDYKKRLFGDDKTTGLFVSLYLILLAFFILLGATSQRAADKAKAAIESVNSTFRDEEGLATDAVGNENFRHYAGEQALMNKLKENFYTQFKIDGQFTTKGGEQIEFDIPSQFFFERTLIALTPEAKTFLDQVADGAKTVGYGLRLQASFFVHDDTTDDLNVTTPEQRRRVRRMSEIADYLVETGFDGGNLTTGFLRLSEGQMKVALRITSVRDASFSLKRPEIVQ